MFVCLFVCLFDDADTVIPTLPLVDIASNNAKHTTLAKAGDTVFVTIESSELVDLPVVTLASRSATVALFVGFHSHYHYGTGDKYNATIVVAADGDIQGNVSILVVFEDAAGNSGVDVVGFTEEQSHSGFVTIGECVRGHACMHGCGVDVLMC